MQETIEVKLVRKPSKRTLRKWHDMTDANYHGEVRLAIAEYFGHSIDEEPASPYGYRFVNALRWINDRHQKVGYLEHGLGDCCGIITHSMLSRIGEVYGKDVMDSVYHCL